MNERGFTLVELLVAMIASALLFLALGSVTGSLAQRVDASRERPREFANARGLSALAKLADRAVPTENEQGVRISASTIVFPITPPMASGSEGRLLVELNVERGEEGHLLVASLLDPLTHSVLAGSREVLLSSQSDLSLDAKSATTTAGDILITSISAARIGEKGEVRRFVVPTRINAKPGCRFDPISLVCRP